MDDLINGFLSDTGNLITNIEHALKQHDYSTIQSCLHTIKGSAHSIGATSLGCFVSLIHDSTRKRVNHNLAELITELKYEFKQTQSALVEYLAELDSSVT
ncbi:MAG: Hpt domain-containing protein [Gammaproteobacteria bacterium]|nr:Hpt domain-containing protein [Gammaproteobacteria bacterium]